MDLSIEFVKAWNDQIKTTPSATIAKQVDPKVSIIRNPYNSERFYYFSDHSSAWTKGRGKNFKIGVN